MADAVGGDPVGVADVGAEADAEAVGGGAAVPEADGLGGGVGNIEELYTDRTRAKITAAIFNPTFEAALLKPTLGDSAGVFGAAMLVR